MSQHAQYDRYPTAPPAGQRAYQPRHAPSPTVGRVDDLPAPVAALAKPRRWPWVLGIVAALIVGIGIGGAGNRTTPATSSSPQSAPIAQAPAVLEEQPAAQSGPLTTFGNGTYEVGPDVKPGKYRSPGVVQGLASLCYWDLTDEKGTIKDQGVANEGPSRATLREGLTFKSQGCEDWAIQ